MPSILQSAFADPYYSLVIQAISHACNQNDYTPALFLFQTLEEEEKVSQRIVASGLIDGLVVTADTIESAFVSKIEQYDIPFVQIGRPPQASAHAISYVDVDNEAGAYLATSHLIQLGYRRIGQGELVNIFNGFDQGLSQKARQGKGSTADFQGKWYR